MDFTKMHGCGNDFVVMAPTADRDWPALARAICDRHYSVGADGLILALQPSAVDVTHLASLNSDDASMSFHNESGSVATVADVRMRIFNADGSEAEMCGNGIRCLAQFAAEHDMVAPNRNSVAVETLAGIRIVKLVRQDGRIVAGRVGMGEPRLAPAEIPVALDPATAAPLLDYPLVVGDTLRRVSFVSMGNPHAVCFLTTPVADFPLTAVGPAVEHYHLFPQRINFEIARAVGPGHFEARVWERGVGETLACGTGACAIAVAAHLKGLGGDDIDITLPGGTLHIAWPGRGEVQLIGPTTMVFRGRWPE